MNARLDNTTNTNNWADFPGLGYNEEAIYITSNQMQIFGQGDFEYSKVRALKKAQLYSGSTPDYKDFTGMNNSNGIKAKDIKPSHQFGTATGFYLMNTSSLNSPNFVTIWRVDNPFGTNPSITRQTSINIGAYNIPPSAIQKGSTETIDTKDSRISDVVYRDGYLYGAFTASNSNNDGSLIRYLKINAGNNSIVWNETYGGEAGVFYYYPEIYPDVDGDVVMVFNKSSSNDYAGIAWAYRMSSDQSMSSSKWLKEGLGPYVNKLNNVNRWGDYNGICLDPEDGNKIWIYGEYATATITDWSTWVGSISTELLITFTNLIDIENAGGTLTVNNIYPPINSGGDFPLELGSSNNVKTNNERFSNWNSSGVNYKHNKWNDVSGEYFLSHNFTANYGADENQKAKFIKMDYSKIEARLEGSFINGKGTFQFQDPWFVKSDGSQPGNYWITANGLYEPTGKEGATEKGVFLNQGLPNWAAPYYSVKAQSPQNINLGGALGTHKFYFLNWSGTGGVTFQNPNSLQTAVVFNSSNAVAEANLKGTQLSSDTSALASNGQRKLIKTPNGYLHQVYTSLGQVWYERSTDNGVTWDIMNGGNSVSVGTAKLISMDYFNTTGGNVIAIVYQAYNSTGSNLILDLYLNGVFKQAYGLAIYSHSSGDIPNFNTNPVVAINSNGQILVTWYVDGNISGTTSGFYYKYGYIYLSFGIDPLISWYTSSPVNLGGSGITTINPSVSVYKASLQPFQFVYENGSQIYHQTFTDNPNSINHIDISTAQDISSGSGFARNNNPSVTAINGGAYAVWEGRKLLRNGTVKPSWAVAKNLINNVFSQFSNSNEVIDALLPNINLVESSSKAVLAWSENSTGYVGEPSPDTLHALNISGKYMQVSNGATKSQMYATTLNVSSSPFSFQLSQNIGTLLGLNKSSSSLVNIIRGRKGVVYNNGAEFYFSVGNIKVDGKNIDFVDIPDTVNITGEETLNKYLVSEPFLLNNKSNFTYSVKYGIIDSISAVKLLDEDNDIDFTVELVDAGSNKIIGKFDDIKYTQTNTSGYDNNIDYKVDTKGIGNKKVRLRLKVESNFVPKYALTKVITGNGGSNDLNKTGYMNISYEGSITIKDYTLSQNYPNPFNPSTTINYQLPKAGVVTLKIYDILGREVKTLVNDFKAKGRYSVNFNAGELASGVYIYRLKVNDFSSVKKLLLLK